MKVRSHRCRRCGALRELRDGRMPEHTIDKAGKRVLCRGSLKAPKDLRAALPATIANADFESILRQALDASPLTQAALASASGLFPIQISRFRRGIHSLNIEAAGKLADALGLRLVKKVG